jgi:hypothetical protein
MPSIKSFSQFDPPRRLASIASNLIHVVRFQSDSEGSLPLRMLSDAEHYIEWTTPVVSQEIAQELEQLRQLVTGWQSNWQEVWGEPQQRTHLVEQCQLWSDRLIEYSGLAKV